MKLSEEQIENIKLLKQNLLTNVRQDNNTLTFVMADGSERTFSVTDIGIDLNEALKGDKGPAGERGFSPYDIYRNQGGTLSESAWIDSLKGPVGEQGDPGRDGMDAEETTIIDKVMISDFIVTNNIMISDPVADLVEKSLGNYALRLTLPSTWPNRWIEPYQQPEFTIKVGTVTTVKDKNPVVSVNNEDNATVLNFQIPVGEQGDPGNDATELPIDGNIVDVNVSVNMISENKEPFVTVNEQDKVWNFVLNIPKGLQGDIGNQGPTGASITQNSAVEYVTITDNLAEINNPINGKFKPFVFTKNNSKCFGFSASDSNGTIQLVAKEDGTAMFIRKGTIFNDINDGWISVVKR